MLENAADVGQLDTVSISQLPLRQTPISQYAVIQPPMDDLIGVYSPFLRVRISDL